MNLSLGFSKLKAILLVLSTIVPVVQSLVQQAEALFPAGTPGAAKLAYVKEAIGAIWGTIQGVEADFETVWPSIEKLVASMVTAFNGLKQFAHGGTPVKLAGS